MTTRETAEAAVGEQGSLGERIREMRRMRAMTLVQLAARAGLSHPFLSQVERGKATPSMGSLGRIAHALGTSQIELLSDPGEPPGAPAPQVLPAAQASRGTYGDRGGEARLLVKRPDARFRPLAITGHRLDFGEAFAHAEHEFVHVVAGRMEIELDGELQMLETGDSVYYDSDVPHRWRAVDDAGFHALVVKEQPRAHTPTQEAS